MMSTLKLRINKYVDSDGGPPPEVPVGIWRIDPVSGANRRDVPIRREFAPISLTDGDAHAVSLQPGPYYVEAVLPSGEVLNDRIDVPPAGDVLLVLEAENSPNEWLSWQHLIGNVSTIAPSPPEQQALTRKKRSAPQRQSARKKRVGGGAASAVRTTTRLNKGLTGKGRGTLEVRAVATVVAPPVDIRSNIACLTSPLPSLFGQGDVWRELSVLRGPAEQLLSELNSGQSPSPIPVVMRDPGRGVYRVSRGPSNVSGTVPLPYLPRNFLAIPQSRSVELLSLPTPWPQIRTGREAIIEIVVQQTVLPGEFVSSIGVRDEQLAVLLGFLSTGALGAVREIAESAIDLLYVKTQNPLAAVAGAYALVGTATDTQSHEWHQWVQNLATWYPHVPDGAIQLAQLLLRLRRSPSDSAQAASLLKQAYHQGLPYYSLGVRWLQDGLERLSQADPGLAEMARAVQVVATRIHPQSPFTIIRLGVH